MSHRTAAGVRKIVFVVVAATMSSAIARADEKLQVPRILVLAPTVVNPDPQFAWLGAGMQRSLAADLTRHLPQQIQTSDTSANNAAGAATLADKAGAQHVISSTIQLAGDQIRVTGEVLDVANHRLLFALKVTGRLNDLFEMEDELAVQTIRGLAPPRPVEKSTPPPVTIAPSGPIRLDYGRSASQAGLQYARPYVDDRFQAAQDRYFYGSPSCGCCGWGCGCGCGFGWGYSIYPTASPGWAW